MTGEVINHLLQSTVFAILAGLLTLAFRKNRARVRYWLWFSASVKFLVPFALLLTLGGYLGRSPAAKSIPFPAMTYTVVEVAVPFPVTPSPTPSPHQNVDWIASALISLWVCWALGIALMRARAWLRIRAAVRDSKPLQIPFPVPVRSSRHLLEPGVVGIFRPILLLPAGILEHLAPKQLEAILAHELCHVRRRDNLTAAVHMVVEALFWFHPFVWWISARLMEERERACDEDVLELGSEPRTYAESILKTCEFCVESPLACVSGVTGADLKGRIVRIMTQPAVDKLGLGRKVVLIAIAIVMTGWPMVIGLVSGPQIHAQSVGEAAGPRPQFEVASIKRNRSGELIRGVSTPRGRFIGRNLRIRPSIAWAYHVQSSQVIGGPSWLDSDDYNIEAKVDEALTQDEKLPFPQRMDQLRLMLQSLFAERFQLKVSHETREGPAYALVVATDGPKFQVQRPGEKASRRVTGPDGVTSQSHAMGLGPGELRGFGMSMAELVALLSGQLGRPVLDETGLKGVYDILFLWTPTPMATGFGISGSDASSVDPSEPSIFTVIQEQLGLKLEPTKAPVEVIVIDHVERPSEN
jgi:uncharacterized protein (TIGR03435 family)